ncbi:MAG TPA: hypothetical protein DIU35_04795, partial [Candidatus Latescibacteria bacterium]|nr:hypothetical protein [Candidatus Latescibacterota bacterium]
MKRIFSVIAVLPALILGLTISAGAQMALDLDTAPGDQGVRKGAAKNGETVKVQLVTTGPVQDLVGVEFELKFDNSQVAFKGFIPSGLLKGAMALPKPVPGGQVIAVAIMGNQVGSGSSETLGEMSFGIKNLGTGVAIELTKGSFGKKAGTQDFGLDISVRLMDEAAAKMGVGAQGHQQHGQQGKGH